MSWVDLWLGAGAEGSAGVQHTFIIHRFSVYQIMAPREPLLSEKVQVLECSSTIFLFQMWRSRI